MFTIVFVSFDGFVVPLLSQANYFYGQYSRGSVALPAGMPRICDVLYNGWQTVHIIKINSITINNKYTTKREITCLCCVFMGINTYTTQPDISLSPARLRTAYKWRSRQQSFFFFFFYQPLLSQQFSLCSFLYIEPV